MGRAGDRLRRRLLFPLKVESWMTNKMSKWIFVLTLACGSASAQQITGSIRGTVSDPSGAVVQSATVSAKQVETGFTRTTISDHAGSFLLLELPVGHYRIEVAAQGFETYVQKGIVLDVNETAAVAVRLAVGSGAEK